MNYGGSITLDIERLLELFVANCSDTTTLNELLVIVRDRSKWKLAHSLFQRIRKKTLAAPASESQYLFEEICAKTLYNLSGEPAPFDADSPYWVIPNAIALGRQLGLHQSTVLACVSPARTDDGPNV